MFCWSHLKLLSIAKININATRLHLGILLTFATQLRLRMGRYHMNSDKVGIASAVICTVHCLIVPVFFLLKFSSVGSVLPSWWDNLDYLFLFISFIAVYHAASHAVGKVIKLSLWLFWMCLAIAIIFEHRLHWMAYVASTGLIATHVANIRRHQLIIAARKSVASDSVVAE
jgi:hypothetical protein